MADRAAIRSTLVGRLIERVNDGRLSKGAVLASGESIGLGDLTLGQLAERPTVGSDDFTVIAPAAIRAGAGKTMDKVGKAALIVAPGGSTDGETVEVAERRDDGGGGGGGGVYVTEANRFFPAGATGKTSDKTSSFTPGLVEWLDPGATAIKMMSPSLPEDSDVLLFTGDGTPEEIFGTPVAESPLTPVDAGATFETASTVFAAPSGVAFDGPDANVPIRAVFEEGSSAPLYGVTFGMGVLATPDAEAANQSVNPLVETDTVELLETDQVRTLLERTSVTDADEVRWLAGPTPVEVADDLEVTVFDESPDDPGLESFVGTVAGDEGPWRVGVHVVRLTLDDHLIIAGSHRWPAGSAEGTGAVVEEPPVSMRRARTLLTDAASRLESR